MYFSYFTYFFYVLFSCFYSEGLDDESVGGGRELSNFVGRPASLIWRAQLARKRQKFSPRRPIML